MTLNIVPMLENVVSEVEYAVNNSRLQRNDKLSQVNNRINCLAFSQINDGRSSIYLAKWDDQRIKSKT